jgi:hypothetical protein
VIDYFGSDASAPHYLREYPALTAASVGCKDLTDICVGLAPIVALNCSTCAGRLCKDGCKLSGLTLVATSVYPSARARAAPAVLVGEKQTPGSRGSLEPPGPLPTHLHTVYMGCSECLPTLLNCPQAERTCFSQVRVFSGRVDSVTILSPQQSGTTDVVDADNIPVGSWVSRSGGGFTIVGTTSPGR